MTNSKTTSTMQSKLSLRVAASLADYQEYVRKLKVERGFKDDKNKALILLMKDVGQLAAGIRKTWPSEAKSMNGEVEEIRKQVADVFIGLVDVANQYGINIEEAFRTREDYNKTRVWEAYHLA